MSDCSNDGVKADVLLTDSPLLRIRNAREHNLRGVDLDLPRHQLIVFTGVSGSGKSSLAFDTIHKEGQRRFMESLSAYARQFLGSMERPKADRIDGLSPTVCIDQKTVNRNPRSTVGTITEIYDHLRLLFARLGQPHCPVCSTPISRVTRDQVVDQILLVGEGRRAMALGPVVRARKGEYRKELEDLRRDGWMRVRIDGAVCGLDQPIALARYEQHTIEVVVDRIATLAAERSRWAEAVETAARLGGGVFSVLFESEDPSPQILEFSLERACPRHPDIAIPELEPRMFSFNAPQGACPTCAGLGLLEGFAVDRLLNLDAALPEAFLAFNDEGRIPFSRFDRATLLDVARRLGAPKKATLRDWPKENLDALLYGADGVVFVQNIDRGDGRTDVRERSWQGLIRLLEDTAVWSMPGTFDRFRHRQECPACRGERLNPVALAVRFRERPITAYTQMSVEDAHRAFGVLELADHERTVGLAIVQEIRDRLIFLHEVGLDYLSLDRSAATLSGGEGQRIRLASQVGSALQGVTYVLDEPSIGLHARDNRRLIRALCRLRDRGNTVIVVEHDAETVRAADYVVEVGPGAGREGGGIVAAGPRDAFLASSALTAAYLRGDRAIEPRSELRSGSGQRLWLQGANGNNLRQITVGFPLETFTVVTGVSGSGKSTLVFDVLEGALTARFAGRSPEVVLEGFEHLDKLVTITQQPIGRTPRSNPATYTGALDLIRDLFAATPEARARGYKKGRFSFNVAGGRCEECQGAGVKLVEMQFLPSVEVLCDACAGQRFNPDTLEITWRGRTIRDVLELTIGEALEVFQPIPRLRRILDTLQSVGLGYISLGQSATTLSGGEAQRLKLASELHRPATGRTLYLLDEPTTGLHFEDVRRLLDALNRLVDGGNTVIVVEHNIDVIRCADHLIDLGPEGGHGGGRIVGEGTPHQVAALDTPTGRALAELYRSEASGALLAAEPLLPIVSASLTTPRALVVEGARKHNLCGVDVRIPHGQTTVITGPSGSGKTSLAFDTIFSEGQRRYVESLSTYARRFLGRMERAPVDRIEGLAPAIAIDQQASSQNPRSTVATVTEIHDVLRLLYARVGTAHCPICDMQIRGWTPHAAAVALRERALGTGWLVAPVPPAEDPAVRRVALLADGWNRLLSAADGTESSLEDSESESLLAQGAWLVIDRLDAAKSPLTRISEAVERAHRVGQGIAVFVPRDREVLELARFSRRAECPVHGVVHAVELTPRHFSFNSRLGACPACDGLGRARVIVPERLFPSRELSFFDALDPRVGSVIARSPRVAALVQAVLDHLKIAGPIPVSRYSAAQWDAVLNGVPGLLDLRWKQSWGKMTRVVEEQRPWPGLVPILGAWDTRLEWLTEEADCPSCEGGRLRSELQAVRIGDLGLPALTRLTVADARRSVAEWSFDAERTAIAARPREELERRLRFLEDVGLGYLPLDRAAETLSGGEAQRIRLASQLGTGLTGVIYVLDEPTVGLHPQDTDRLLATLDGLRDLGNTLVIVEHDLDTIWRADQVLDLGPGAGRYGGQVLARGTPAEIRDNPDSPTGAWLSGRRRFPERATRRAARKAIVVRQPTAHNLRCGDVSIPTGVWVGMTGVSGSGKSTLVMDTLAPALRRHLGQDVAVAPCAGLEVGERIQQVIVVDQSPIGRSPRSTPATYTSVMDPLRALFAATQGAKERGWTAGRFSFNNAEGRCAACEGRGATLVEMHFLPDVWILCPQCEGRRFDRETLSVRWKGHSIADVLAMRADEALELFAAIPALARPLRSLVEVGLGYLALGQPGTTLSGGEAQRVKLAAELGSRRGHCIYMLDEPTTGLHLSDVAQLVEVLHRLVDAGHSLLTIEHHLDFLAQADWLIEMGPGGGVAGGQVIAAGTPEAMTATDTPTGRALRRRVQPAGL